MVHLTPEHLDQLVAARLAGAQINELARQFNQHRATIIKHLNDAGVPHRARRGRELSPERLEAAGLLYASGLSLLEVGERFDVDRRYLRQALPAAGFALRPSGPQAKGRR